VAQSFLTGIIIIAVLFVLVRPGSKGPTLVHAVSGGLQGLLGKATGGGTWR
jgi:Na+-translocating ferredoxin:NAD+ oxidoreductase RnfD subunit